jgi:hypothetical protein
LLAGLHVLAEELHPAENQAQGARKGTHSTTLCVSSRTMTIAAITPARLLREILLSDELAKHRRDHTIAPPDTTGSTSQPDASKPQ